MDTLDRFRGCLLGLAVGDALGTTVEFRPRGTFEPVADMVSGGPFDLEPGQWTDDTSMALCLATSLVETGEFDAHDQMERYCRWRYDGYMSCTGTRFDIGTSTSSALQRYRATGDPFSGSTDPRAAGNGCLMHLAPAPMYFWPDVGKAAEYSAESARTTHGASECLDACRLFGAMLCRALSGATKEDILDANDGLAVSSERIRHVADADYLGKSAGAIRGSGYVVESLEAALWCFARTDSYADAVLTAVNLGDDADATGAICGQIAGAFYGEEGIPRQWLDMLAMRDTITGLAERSFSLKAIDAPLWPAV